VIGKLIARFFLKHEASPEVDVSKLRELLRAYILDCYDKEYKEIALIWQRIEAKAQGNVAIAGVFIGAVLAFVRESGARSLPETVMLVLATVMLAISLIFSILALRVRKTTPDAPYSVAGEFCFDLLVFQDAELLSRFDDFLKDHRTVWRKSNDQLNALRNEKARHLWFGQLWLALAILTVALLAGSKLFFPYPVEVFT